ncbi:TetR/AcrR family transcriptional regulator [Nocardioides xinjiangensis]|uniref:TetR/AcrR family transcriptional regulator n=1 Tax=Nocardioides xinjiangensis TaxID=2817376 RepID=UPI001B305A3D|nr:TetR/AcrR family transcriptional regulator [Nocardioides sp. SYSU D00514]
MLPPPAPDGRSAVREEHGRALVDAARALASERGARGFTIDQVAALAGVSRRTVFNHFGGIEQLLVAVCDQVLAEATADLLAAVDRLTGDLPTGTAGGRAALDALVEATREVDLATAIVTIHRVLGAPAAGDERAAAISRRAFEHVGGRLRGRLLDRAPHLDPLDLELTLTLLTNGLTLLAGHWLAQHPDLTADVPAVARADWDRLVDRLLHRLRVGHAG